MSLIKLEGKIGQMVGKLYQKIKNYLNACLAAYQKTELIEEIRFREVD